jgi:hypothetical protein
MLTFEQIFRYCFQDEPVLLFMILTELFTKTGCQLAARLVVYLLNEKAYYFTKLKFLRSPS